MKAPADLMALLEKQHAHMRAGIQFKSHIGRAPSRKDFRAPERARWQGILGLELPSDSQVCTAFGSWSAYLRACDLTRVLSR